MSIKDQRQNGSNDTQAVLARRPHDAERVLETTPLGPEPFETQVAMASTSAGHPLSLAALLRCKWTFILVFLVLALPGAAAVWLTFVPEYQAGAVVEVSPVIPRLVYKTENNGVIPLYRQYLNTQVAIICSPEVLERVLDRPDVQQTDWYRHPPRPLVGQPAPPLERLLKGLSVRPRRDTHVIDVRFTARSPEDAAAMANAAVEEYRKYVVQSSRRVDDDLYQKLTDEYKSRRATIEGLESTTNRFRKDLGTGDPDALLSHRRTRLEEMEAEREALQREIAFTEWQLARLEASAAQSAGEAGGGSSPAAAQRRCESDADWRKLLFNLEMAQHRVEVEQQRLGDAHPEMIALKKDVELAARLLRAREAQLELLWEGIASGAVPAAATAGGPLRSPEALQDQLERLRCQKTLLAQDIAAHDDEVQRTTDVVQTLAAENDALRHQRELYEAVRMRLTQREMERGAPGSIRIQSGAFPRSQPSNERRRLLLSALAIAAGAALALLVTYLRAAGNKAVQEDADLPAAAGSPFLGYLPLVRSPQRMSPDEQAVQAESVRMVRTALLERLNGQRGAAVLVTSAGAAAGKTTVATLLAKSLAQCGKRVLLVDADLRNPEVAARCEVASAPGLIDLLTDAASDSAAIRSNGLAGLDVLPAGNAEQLRDPELLANGAFAARLERWRKRYDLILVDTPPVLPVADTRILSSQVDGAVMVVREGHCRRSEVVAALAFLGASGGSLLGTVFVRAPRRRGHSPYYSGYYRFYGRATAALDVPEG